MAPRGKTSSHERRQTDRSLRVERESADAALSEKLAAIEEAADAVISRARERADEVVAASRARSDRQSQPQLATRKARAVEDAVVQEERADADEALRTERAEGARLLSSGRQNTDSDLLTERTKSDGAVAVRDEFLGIVSHDLRNILASMMGYAGLIAKATEPGDERLMYAQRIQRTGGRMNRLVGDLLDVVSIEAGTLSVTKEPADLARVVNEAVETLSVHAAAHGIDLVFDDPREVPSLFDPARILQVVINLVSNAIKFTPGGGRVVVRIDAAEGEATVRVRDTGIGIPRDRLTDVFERFLQIDKRDRRGLGLGLYISKCIIAGHGGRIWAESATGAGSTFSFTLPMAGG